MIWNHIRSDIENVHHKKWCKSDVWMISSSNKSGINEEIKLSSKYEKQKEKSGTNSFWILPHGEENCQVCDYDYSSKSSREKGKKAHG